VDRVRWAAFGRGGHGNVALATAALLRNTNAPKRFAPTAFPATLGASAAPNLTVVVWTRSPTSHRAAAAHGRRVVRVAVDRLRHSLCTTASSLGRRARAARHRAPQSHAATSLRPRKCGRSTTHFRAPTRRRASRCACASMTCGIIPRRCSSRRARADVKVVQTGMCHASAET
jgi:hypothetical protein